jgi:hypothetical protein
MRQTKDANMQLEVCLRASSDEGHLRSECSTRPEWMDSRAGDGGNAGFGCCQRVQLQACLEASSDEGHLKVCKYRDDADNNMQKGSCSQS